MKTLKDFNFKDKKALVRCDFNVPLDKEGNILDDYRIKETVPTIKYLIKNGAKIILMSHLDNPEGKVVENLRLNLIQGKLMEYLDCSVKKASDCVGKKIEEWVKNMQFGEILLLENLRFHKEEEENNPEFTKELSKLGEIYINEAFSCSHRSHASIVGVPKYLPAAAGLLLEKEIKIFSQLLEKPQKPLLVIVGGKKVETKAKFIDKISEIADWVLIGGLIEKELKEKNLTLKYPQKIMGPIDDIDTFDIGPRTIELFKEKIAEAKTIFWNGPLGKFEEEIFSKGSREIANAIIESGAFSIVGGGETVEFINKIGLTDKFNHLSTGGGAMLAYLSGEKLPGIEVLNHGN